MSKKNEEILQRLLDAPPSAEVQRIQARRQADLEAALSACDRDRGLARGLFRHACDNGQINLVTVLVERYPELCEKLPPHLQGLGQASAKLS